MESHKTILTITLLMGALGIGCTSSSPEVIPDYCEPNTPPDAACYSARRDPASSEIALALEIADAQIARHPATELAWDWGESVMMLGMVELYRVTREPRLLEYMRTWIDHHIDIGYTINTSDRCPPALVAMLLYAETREEKYRTIVLEVLDYLANDALRTSDGGINHLGVISGFGVSIWLDSLFMFGNVVTRWTEFTGEPEHIAVYRDQFHIFMDVLQDENGLLRHADVNWIVDQDPDVYWARGNAWVTAATFDYLRVLRARGEEDDFALRAIRRQLDGALEYQDGTSGRWWTILNRPGDTYEETSATALFAYAIARGWRYGFLDDDYLVPMWAAVDGVLAKIERNDENEPVITDISEPTSVADFDYYASVGLRSDISYGVGAALLMLVEVSGLAQPD